MLLYNETDLLIVNQRTQSKKTLLYTSEKLFIQSDLLSTGTMENEDEIIEIISIHNRQMYVLP